MNDGRTAKPSTGSVTTPPITAPSPSVARGEERVARVRRLSFVLARVRRGRAGRERRARLGLDLGRRRAHGPRDVADPEEAEDERDHAADHRGDGADDEPGEDDGDADRETDRPEARRRRVRRLVVVRAQVRFPW